MGGPSGERESECVTVLQQGRQGALIKGFVSAVMTVLSDLAATHLQGCMSGLCEQEAQSICATHADTDRQTGRGNGGHRKYRKDHALTLCS